MTTTRFTVDVNFTDESFIETEHPRQDGKFASKSGGKKTVSKLKKLKKTSGKVGKRLLKTGRKVGGELMKSMKKSAESTRIE